MLIDSTYFDGPVILHANSNQDAITDAIDTYESKYLQALLGPSLYAAFIAGISVSGNGWSSGFSSGFGNGGIVAERWDWIRDGHTFTHGGVTYIWPGLTTPKQSPLAIYVWYHFLLDNNPAVTSVNNFASPKLENSAIASPKRPMASRWNQMVNWNRVLGIMVKNLTDATTGELVYPEFNRYEMGHPDSYDLYEHIV